MPKRKLTKPDRYDPKARSFGGPWRMVKCKDGPYVCYEQHMEIVDNLRKNAEINPAQSPHDGIHTCSKGCNKPGCNRGLRDTIEEQDAQIVALKQDLLEQSAAARHLRFERVHDLNHIGGLQEEVASLKAKVEKLTFDPLTYLDDQGEWMPRHIHFAAVEGLQAEVERLTERLNRHLEINDELDARCTRLRKAGDAMAETILKDCIHKNDMAALKWNAAKEGKQP